MVRWCDIYTWYVYHNVLYSFFTRTASVFFSLFFWSLNSALNCSFVVLFSAFRSCFWDLAAAFLAFFSSLLSLRGRPTAGPRLPELTVNNRWYYRRESNIPRAVSSESDSSLFSEFDKGARRAAPRLAAGCGFSTTAGKPVLGSKVILGTGLESLARIRRG